MKVIITADWHFGYPGRLDDLANAFKCMINFCVKHEIKIIILAGDLAHNRESLTHDVSNTISELFDQMNKHGIHLIGIVGNHDMFYRHKWNVNAIKPFSKQITYVDTVSHFEIDNRRFWVVPFIEHEPFYMKVVNDVNKLASEDDILITHIGIASAKMNSCFLVTNWSVVSFENTKFNKVFAGHFHNHQKVGTKSWYTGSPVPFRFDEGLVEHGFIVYDVISNKQVFIDLLKLMPDDIRPPDFITATSKDIDQIVKSSPKDRVKIELDVDDNPEIIKEQLSQSGISNVVFVKPKEECSFIKPEGFTRSDNIFKSWINYDKPEHLNGDLLVSLDEEIRSESRYNDD